MKTSGEKGAPLTQLTGDFMFQNLQDQNNFLANYASMRYWQVAFWGFLCIVNFFTLTLWYSQPNIIYTVPVLIQSLLGLLFSIALQRAIIYLWHSNLILKSLLNIVLVAGIAMLWTIGRMYVFEFSTKETHIWQEFGGWYFSSIFIFISWTALFYGIQYYRLLQEKNKDMLIAEAKARQSQIKHMEAQAAAKDAQLEMLRYQLNPHFLCNTLNAINALVEVQENEKAQTMTVNLSHFLRFSLENMPDGKVTLEHEIDTLWMYLRIEKTRFEDRLQIKFDLDDASLQALVPSLLLQPLIENCMKHAISKNELGGTISICSASKNNQLQLTIEDSGPGKSIDKSSVVDLFDTGVGMKNTNQRLNILYGRSFDVALSTSNLGGLKTTITIPLEFDESSQITKKRTA